jgi:hypothetical protein
MTPCPSLQNSDPEVVDEPVAIAGGLLAEPGAALERVADNDPLDPPWVPWSEWITVPSQFRDGEARWWISAMESCARRFGRKP